jgi:hypothetical protein
MMKAWYFEPVSREWKKIRGSSIVGVRLARALGYRLAFGKGTK